MKKILYIFHYGDQHNNKNIKTISDGGSNIHIHLLQALSKNFKITISTYKDNYLIKNFFCKNKNIQVREYPTLSGLFKKNLLFYELALRCFYPAFSYFKKLNYNYLITQTDFLPDTITALLIKLKNPRIIWIASYFLEAPKPWDKDSPYKGRRWLIGLFYWLLQRPSYWIVKKYANYVLVTSDPDIKKFITNSRDKSKIVVVQGGVEIGKAQKYLKSKKIIPLSKRRYDACFLGRFHYQKGVLELIDIWKEVVKIKANAKLAMIGWGPLENDVKAKIKKYKLSKNICLLGYLSGTKKHNIFKQSKVILHPATHDSGGMAAAEGMAWGLPGVMFDLESAKTYYPAGMIKTSCFDCKKFAQNIIDLLEKPNLYSKIKKDALKLISTVWDWDIRSKKVIEALNLQ